jgi:hypothetical protein
MIALVSLSLIFPDCVWALVGGSQFFSAATGSKSSSFLSSNCSHAVFSETRPQGVR